MSPNDLTSDPYLSHNMNDLPQNNTDSSDSDEKGGGGAFIALYTSLMLLLLSFFIVLFSMATASTGKFVHAQRSLQNEFSTLGLNTAKKTLIFMYSLMKIKTSFNPVLHPYLQDDTEDFKKKKKRTITKVYWEGAERIDVTAKMGDLILLGVNAERQKNDLLLRIPTHSLFYSGSTKLTPAGKLLITNMRNIIKSDFESIAIHAYSDEKTSAEDGLFSKDSFIMSTEQAYAVAQEISEQFDMPIENFSFYGYGKYRSSDPSSTLKTDVFNNRIELWIRELWTFRDEEITIDDKTSIDTPRPTSTLPTGI